MTLGSSNYSTAEAAQAQPGPALRQKLALARTWVAPGVLKKVGGTWCAPEGRWHLVSWQQGERGRSKRTERLTAAGQGLGLLLGSRAGQEPGQCLGWSLLQLPGLCPEGLQQCPCSIWSGGGVRGLQLPSTCCRSHPKTAA